MITIDPVVVRPIQRVEPIELSDTHLETRFQALKSVLEPAISSGASDSILLFGLPGTGNVLLASALGKWLSERLPDYKALLVNFEIARAIPDVQSKKARRIIGPWLGEIRTLEKMPKEGWILVLQNVDALSPDMTNRTLEQIGSFLTPLILDLGEERPAVVISTTNNPAAMDPAILARFGKRFYIPPASTEQIPNWLVAGGLEPSSAAQVSTEVTDFAATVGWDYFAPEYLVNTLTSEMPRISQTVKEEPSSIAKFISTDIGRLFIDGEQKTKFEDENSYFISQSRQLEDLSFHSGN